MAKGWIRQTRQLHKATSQHHLEHMSYSTDIVFWSDLLRTGRALILDASDNDNHLALLSLATQDMGDETIASSSPESITESTDIASHLFLAAAKTRPRSSYVENSPLQTICLQPRSLASFFSLSTTTSCTPARLGATSHGSEHQRRHWLRQLRLL